VPAGMKGFSVVSRSALVLTWSPVQWVPEFLRRCSCQSVFLTARLRLVPGLRMNVTTQLLPPPHMPSCCRQGLFFARHFSYKIRGWWTLRNPQNFSRNLLVFSDAHIFYPPLFQCFFA